MSAESPVREASAMPRGQALRRQAPVIRLALHSDINELENEWLAFQAHASGTLYQSHQWCRAWQETAGRAHTVEPRIVTGREANGRLLFILPFGLRHAHGLRILEWHSGRQCNYGYGLYDRGFLRYAERWFASQAQRILDLAGPIDAIDLGGMPARWNGFRHPLSSWFTLAGPNVSFFMRLAQDFDALYEAKRSAETRRGNRKRDAKLARDGNIAFGLPATRAEMHERIEEMFAHQAARLAESGVYHVFDTPDRDFFHRLVDLPDHMQPILLPYHLTIDGRMEAMMLGGHFGNGYWALISSLAPSPARRNSPGDAALRKTIEACCARGLSFFDFSSGNAAYKLRWADEAVALHHAIRGVTPRGHAWALGQTAVVAAKRSIKRSPPLWSLASWARRQLAQIRRPRPSESAD
jgi:CelD/BcsL family acetyltransferase involved in cellulose biosynthesis